ncbi:hypothetical protein COOONC_00899, partial [Cooperia oncophora]
LTDAKGTPVGVASVQYLSAGSGHPVVLSYHPRAGPQQGSGPPIASLQRGSASPTTHERVAHIIPFEQGSVSTQTQAVIANVPSLAQPRVVQATQIVQKQNDNTFRFAQMGSGGQFTVAPPSERTPTKSAPVVMKPAGSAVVVFFSSVIRYA